MYVRICSYEIVKSVYIRLYCIGAIKSENHQTQGRRKFWKSEGATKMAASSIHCIFTGCRGPIDKGQKIPFFFKLDTFSKKAVSKIEVDRERESLHFKGVFWMRRKNPSQITGRHDPAGDWRGSSPTACHGLCPPRALGAAQLCAVGELTNNDQGVTGDLTRRWAVGPANL